MFQLHDRTRRRICIAGFFLLCVVPTMGVLAWGLVWHLPWHVRAEARRLSRELGMTVALGDVRHPRPELVRYDGLQLVDPETGRCVLRCPLVEAGWQNLDKRQGQTRRALVLVASRPELDRGSMDQLWALLRRMLKRHSGPSGADVWLRAGEVAVQAGEKRLSFTDLQGRIETLPAGTQAQFSFHLAGADKTEPVRLQIGRNRQTTPPSSGFALYTGNTAVACSVLAMGLSGLESLGTESRFCGYIWANHTPKGWQGEVTGRLLDADLDRLVSDRFPHTLTGRVDLTITRARFSDGRLEEAGGALVAGPGMISRSLLTAAAGRLGLERGLEPGAPTEVVPYEQLALGFLINADGLYLEGRCPGVARGAILTDRRGRLLGEPSRQGLPTAALLRMLVPIDGLDAPATRQTDWLARRLPLPDAMARPPAERY